MIVVQTGNWPKGDGWCYRIYCKPCDFEDYTDSYDEAQDVRVAHRAVCQDSPRGHPSGRRRGRQGKPSPPKPKPLDESEWEIL